MSIVTKKSTAISNRDASPTLPSTASLDGGMAREASGYVTTGAGDSTNSYYPMVQVPSNARVSQILLESEALGTGCTVNCGVFWPTNPPPLSGQAGASAINATFFASAVDVHAAVARTDITNQAGNNTLDKQDQELWQALGLSADPNCMLDIALQLAAATVNAARIGIKVKYAK